MDSPSFPPTVGRDPLTITQLNERIRDLLENGFPYVKVKGEIRGLRIPASGHLYCTLGDGESQIRAVAWRGTVKRLPQPLQEGEAVEVTGRLSVYPPKGEYQLVIEGLRKAGAGQERELLLKLHARLAEEGLFDPERKRPLPLLPNWVGVVTSGTGAALHDILNVLERRFPSFRLLLCAARVQGEEAPREIAAALDQLNADGRCDVIICGRGGGDAEDLSAFNSETVVRAIARSAKPVVSAVGHEIDVTLADLAADARAPTPSAAAEMVMPEQEALRHALAGLRQRLALAMQRQTERERQRLGEQKARLRHPRQRLDEARLRCDALLERQQRAWQRLWERRRIETVALERRLLAWPEGRFLALLRARLEQQRTRLYQALRLLLEARHRALEAPAARLEALSPKGILQRGYAIARTANGEVIRHPRQAPPEAMIHLTVAEGELHARVSVPPAPPPPPSPSPARRSRRPPPT